MNKAKQNNNKVKDVCAKNSPCRGLPLFPSDEGMTPRSLMFAYLVPAKEEARSKDTRSSQGPALPLGVEGKDYL
jgi:hypothetical protein